MNTYKSFKMGAALKRFNNRTSLRFHIAALLLTLGAILPAQLYAETAENVDPLKPALEATPNSDGLISWWLVSAVQKGDLTTLKPPLNARQGGAIAGEDGGTWQLHVSPPDQLRQVDLKPFVTARSGVIWSSVRLRTQIGKTRRLHVGSYCALKVFRDGQLVLEKPQPQLRDETEAEIEVPAGDCELTVGVAIRSGWAGFQFNLTEGGVAVGRPKAAAGDRFLLPLKAGTEPNIGDALVNSALFVTREAFVTPGQTTTLVLAIQGSLPVGLGEIEVIFKGIDGKPIDPPFPARLISDVPKGIFKADTIVPKDIGFASVVSVDIKSGEKVLGTKKLTLYSLPAIREAVKQLEATALKTQAEQKKFLPNTMLAIDKLNLPFSDFEKGKDLPGQSLLTLLELAKKCLQDESISKDPFDQKVGFFERAYTSIIDEQAQPYQVNIPAVVVESVKKKDGKKFPLVVFLHGYVPSYDKLRWLDAMPEFNDALEQRECLYAAPFGRTNTDFQSCGEVDVMDVIAEMKRLYPVDENRVYLYGYSMGGMAVYTIAAHHPDTFAAAVVFCGRADSPLLGLGASKKPLADLHPYKQWLIHADNPIDLCENLLNLPLRIYHGKEDSMVNISEARRIQKRLTEIGAKAELIEYTGDHWAGYDLMAKDDLLTWMFAQKLNIMTAKFHTKAYPLRHAAQSSVRVTASKGTLTPIELEWEQFQILIRLDASAPSKEAQSPRILKDSDQIVQREIGGKAQPEKLEGQHKRPYLCGPVREAICGPFVLVYGTPGNAEANKVNKENAERFAKEWYAFTRSKAIIKADKDLSETDKKSKNLFLFGAEDENLIHAAAASKLPIKVKAGQVTIADKTLSLEKRGLLYIYPSPFADGADKFAGKTSVVICAGLPYGRDIGTNHKLDLVPDFLLYGENSTPDGTGTNQFVCTGFFNGEWKFDPAQTWWDQQDK